MTELAEKQVLRRHEKAMSVVARVDDVAARWALLGYVLLGGEQVEDAFRGIRRGPRPERRAQIIALRDAGWTFKQMADELGYAHESGPHQIYRRSIRSAAQA